MQNNKLPILKRLAAGERRAGRGESGSAHVRAGSGQLRRRGVVLAVAYEQRGHVRPCHGWHARAARGGREVVKQLHGNFVTHRRRLAPSTHVPLAHSTRPVSVGRAARRWRGSEKRTHLLLQGLLPQRVHCRVAALVVVHARVVKVIVSGREASTNEMPGAVRQVGWATGDLSKARRVAYAIDLRLRNTLCGGSTPNTSRFPSLEFSCRATSAIAASFSDCSGIASAPPMARDDVSLSARARSSSNSVHVPRAGYGRRRPIEPASAAVQARWAASPPWASPASTAAT